MAKAGKSKVTNALVWILLSLLIVGLAGFGVTGFGGQVRSIGSVGQTVIDASTYGRALRQQIDAAAQQLGAPVTFAEAEAMGVPGAVLQQLVASAALEEAARMAGLSVGDAAVGQEVRRIPSFQGPDGTFDREAYRFVLDRSGMTPGTFEEGVRRELASNLLQRAVVTGLRAPASYGEALYTYLAETRSITFAELDAGLLETPPDAPGETEIRAFYDANPDLFTAPAAKRITYAWLSPDMLADEVTVTDEMLRALYEENAEIYNRPERRMVERLGFPDMAAAQAAREAIDAGEADFDALLAERGLSADDVDLGIVARADLATGAAGDAVFALEDTGIAGPVESAVGPALFRVNAILLAQSTSLEEARPELRKEAARQAAIDLVEAEVEALDDLLAGGATLEELAQNSAMQLDTLLWSADTERTAPPLTLPEFAIAADTVTADDFPEIIYAESGIAFALRLDEEVAATLRPFEEVRAAAAEGAARAATRAALRALAETDLDALRDGDAGFAGLGLTPIDRDGLNRQRPVLDLPLPVRDAIYDMEPGEIVLLDGTDSLFLVRLNAVTAPDTRSAQARQVVETLTAEVTRQISDDMRLQLAEAVRLAVGVEINQTAINAVHSALR